MDKDFVECPSLSQVPSRESQDRAVPKRLTTHVKHNSEGSPRKDKPLENATEIDIASQIAELERVIEEEENTGPKTMSKNCFSINHAGQVLLRINNFEIQDEVVQDGNENDNR